MQADILQEIPEDISMSQQQTGSSDRNSLLG